MPSNFGGHTANTGTRLMNTGYDVERYHLALALDPGSFPATVGLANNLYYLGRLDDVFADPAFAGWRADLGNPTETPNIIPEHLPRCRITSGM